MSSQDQIRHLKAVHDDAVYRLILMSTFKDDMSGIHTTKVSRISMIIGKKYGLSGENVEILRLASALHDIGNIAISDHILFKTDKLSTDEWEFIKAHTLFGAKILEGSPSDVLTAAAEVSQSHHEKWDGSGYPFGLAEKQIPLFGRIVAIADVFDALTSSRSYRSAYSIDDSVESIKRQSGQHFDPELVDIFLQSLDQIKRVKNLVENAEKTLKNKELLLNKFSKLTWMLNRDWETATEQDER